MIEYEFVEMLIYLIGLLLNKVLNDLGCYGDFLGGYVGKKVGICTRKHMSSIGANVDRDLLTAIEAVAAGGGRNHDD